MNVAPTADGRITPIYEERLRDIGNGYGSMVKEYMKPDLGGYKKILVDGKFGKHILVYMLDFDPARTNKDNFSN